jgi:hypothetical protein
MNAIELAAAREALGDLWALGRPLKMSEMGRICGYGPVDPGQPIMDMERGRRAIPPPMAKLIWLYRSGILPPGGLGALKRSSEAADQA